MLLAHRQTHPVGHSGRGSAPLRCRLQNLDCQTHPTLLLHGEGGWAVDLRIESISDSTPSLEAFDTAIGHDLATPWAAQAANLHEVSALLGMVTANGLEDPSRLAAAPLLSFAEVPQWKRCHRPA